MNIKVLVSVGEGKVLALSISQGLWVENRMQALCEIEEAVDEAMRIEAEALAQDIDLWRWQNSGVNIYAD